MSGKATCGGTPNWLSYLTIGGGNPQIMSFHSLLIRLDMSYNVVLNVLSSFKRRCKDKTVL